MQLVVVAPLGYRLRKNSKLLYRKPAYLICTDSQLAIEALLQAYLWRWDIEVNFRDEKTLLGVGQAQVRHPVSAQSVPALAVAAYALLLLAARQQEFKSMMTYMLLYSLLYAPTLALTNSLCFHHMDNVDKQFGSIRVFGTIGWILAGASLTFWRKTDVAAMSGDMLAMAGACSVAMGIFCCFLPHTPPKKEVENPWAFLILTLILRSILHRRSIFQQ